VALLAAVPLGLVLALMLGLRWSAARAGSVGLLAALVLGLLVFELPAAPGGAGGAIAGALGEAAFTALTILWIIVPALAIHRLQVAGGAVDELHSWLSRLAGDARLTGLLVAWFFALLLEGAAGFGTAAALAAPFLVALGFPPMRAVAAALVGHAVGVSFGAVGTPVIIQAATTDLDPLALSAATVVYGGLLGWVLVGAVTLMLHRLERPAAPDEAARQLPRVAGVELWGWTVVAWVAFTVPFMLLALHVGPELPTLGGAVLGGAVYVAAILLRRRRGAADEGPGVGSSGRLLRAASPYLVLVAVVLLTRMIEPLRVLLQGIQLRWQLFDGAYSGAFAPLFHPGTMLFLALLVGALVQGRNAAQVGSALAATVRQMTAVAAALVAMLGLARLMLHGGLIDTLALAAADAVGGRWPMLAPALGALGTFVTGSATASNALFSNLQATTAEAAGVSVLSVLGAQGMGAAVGNAIAPHNLIAAAAVVGLAGREAEALRRTAPITAIYLLLGGGLAMLLSVGS
jgi:lactate permease